MNWLKIFSQPPQLEAVQGADEVKRQYKYWRVRIFYSMYIGYVFFYLSRKSFTFAMPAMLVDLGYTKANLGVLASILYIMYGVSKFLSGILSDRSNPRYFMAVGLILTGVFNILFGLSSHLVLFALFWGLNGWFQGWGWPPCARLLTHWYATGERGTWWGIWSTSHNVGGALIPILSAVLAQYYGWRMAMFFPGIICIGLGFFLMNRLRDTPESLGLPRIEKYAGDASLEDQPEASKMSQWDLLKNYVFKNKYIWVLGFAYFLVGVIRTAINDWGQLFLYEEKGFSLILAGSCLFAFELGGFFGSLASGWVSDRLFEGRRGPVNALFSFFAFVILAMIWLLPFTSAVFASLLLFAMGFFIFGPQMLGGLAAAELSHKDAAGTSTGFIGWFAYIGAAAAGFPCGKIAEIYGWSGFFVLLSMCAVLTIVLFIPLWNTKRYRPRVQDEIKTV